MSTKIAGCVLTLRRMLGVEGSLHWNKTYVLNYNKFTLNLSYLFTQSLIELTRASNSVNKIVSKSMSKCVYSNKITRIT